MAAPKGKLVTPVAFEPGGYPLALEVDADGHLKVVFASPAKGLVGSHGYVNGAWHKNPIELGYSGVVAYDLKNTSLAAGSNNLDSPVVPTGWVWIITAISIMYIGTVPTNIGVNINHDTVMPRIFRQLSPASGAIYDRQGYWVLNEGDYLRGYVTGATLNDDLYLGIYGHAINITL